MFVPSTPPELSGYLADCAAAARKVELQGGGTRRSIGAARDASLVSLAAMRGVVDYDPAELVLVVRAGTPLSEVEMLVAGAGQRLAFDPVNPLAAGSGTATIGGAIVGGFSGPGRLSGGAARDHLLGFTAVSGRGEIFRAGGNVVKNVTGYDLSKLIAGSWGRLAAVCELTLKVMPRPRQARTLAMAARDMRSAFAAMSAAMGSRCEVNTAAFLPVEGVVLFRIEGFESSVAARIAGLQGILAAFGSTDPIDEDAGAAHWTAIANVTPLTGASMLWRVALPPSAGPVLVEMLGLGRGHWMADWAGGQIWLAHGDDRAVRVAAEAAGGHAMLVRAPDAAWATIPAMHPRGRGLAALEKRVRRAFDPAGIFETGRFRDISDAD